MSMVEESRPVFSRHLQNIPLLKKWLHSIPVTETSVDTPFWRNDFIPAFDAAAFALMLMEARPKIVLEIGSGNSTKFIRSAIQFLDMDTRIVSVDPFPRAEIDTLCDAIIRKALENAVDDVLGVFQSGRLCFLTAVIVCCRVRTLWFSFLKSYRRSPAVVSTEFTILIFLTTIFSYWPNVYTPNNTCWRPISWEEQTAIPSNFQPAI